MEWFGDTYNIYMQDLKSINFKTYMKRGDAYINRCGMSTDYSNMISISLYSYIGCEVIQYPNTPKSMFLLHALLCFDVVLV